ncbi:MAG: efflux RND transporter periplasmic adaptor subunit [Bacteroidales bacterium]|jgi:RND family efflux transporter MFP subunit|nr:efflux RND transporter periplasmic adaptor subunit [Bacteroidales bacterium]
MKTIHYLIIILVLMFLVSCKETNTTVEPIEQESADDVERIMLTEHQMEAVNIEIGAIEQRHLNHIVRANGELALSPQKKAGVNALMGGIIKQIPVYEGTEVKEGQILAYVENREIVEMQKNYLVAKQEFMISEQNYQRQEELSLKGAGVEKTLQQAAAAHQIASAQFMGLEKQLQQLAINPKSIETGTIVTQIPIKAPISGTIDKIMVNIGSYVDIQTPIMTLSDNSQLHCDIWVFEKDINMIQNGQEVDFMLTNQQNIQFQGKIYGVNKFFENSTKAITVHAQLNAPNKSSAGNKKSPILFPGMYVTALINVGKHSSDAVPNEAIVSMGGKDYIFLLEKESRNEEGKLFYFQPIEVVTGISELGYTEITPLKEIAIGATIVVSNAFYIASMLEGGEEEE